MERPEWWAEYSRIGDAADLRIKERTSKYHDDRIVVETERRRLINQVGEETPTITASINTKLRDVEETYNREASALVQDKWRAIDSHFDKLDQVIEAEKPPEKTPDEKEPELITQPDKNAELIEDYKNLAAQFKKERDDFFADHFKEMVSIAVNPDISQKEIDYFFDRDTDHLKRMAVRHYTQLHRHDGNPQFQKAAQELADHAAREKALADEREAALERKRKEETERRRQIFARQREQITQPRDPNFEINI